MFHYRGHEKYKKYINFTYPTRITKYENFSFVTMIKLSTFRF